MKRNLIVATFFVFACGLIQSTSLAKEGQGYGNKDYHDMPMEKKFFKKLHMIFLHQEDLSVTDEQLSKLDELKVSLKKDFIKKQAEIDLIKVDIRSSLYEDEVNLEAVNVLIDKKYEIKKSKSKQLVASIAQLKKILSKEQMGKMKDLMHKQHKMKPEGSHRSRRNK